MPSASMVSMVQLPTMVSPLLLPPQAAERHCDHYEGENECEFLLHCSTSFFCTILCIYFENNQKYSIIQGGEPQEKRF